MAEVKEGVSLTHAWKHHRSKKKAKGEKFAKQIQFRKVMYSFNKKVSEKVLAGFHTQLPHHMGYIRIVGMKPKNMMIDWKETKETGEVFYHDNRHTDGLVFAWNWQKFNHLVKNMQHYTFIPTSGKKGDSMKERLNKLLVENPRAYKRYMVLKRK
jgi:hypothetical protein